MDYLLADIWARYQKQHSANPVRYAAGVDEHGNKVAAKAREAGITPQEFADENHVYFKQLITKLGASVTDFVRTSDEHHQATVEYIWQQLTPYIYRGTYEGWYCDGCESFVTDKEAAATGGICPDHKQPYQRLSEENYYLKMQAFLPQIKEAIESGKLKIIPNSRAKEFLNLVDKGMPDISISRPNKSLSWGVPVPGDDSQVMYVWIDALANYLSVIGYPDRPDEWQSVWPADVQVIGKDILRFHAGIWPAMLLGLGLPLPKVLLVHGHVHVGGSKMSKTVGNVIDPNEVIDKYGLDAFRYYFSRHINTVDDGDFTWEKFIKAYNGELANDLGNLVSRVANMVNRYQSGVVGETGASEHDVFPYESAMKEFRLSDAINEVWSLVQGLNRYIDETKPWTLAKDIATDAEKAEHLGEILTHAVSTLLQIADMLSPFIPDAAARIKDIFGSGVVKGDSYVLFPRVELPAAPAEAPQPAQA
jgi:methionyl-tRNA synthetase